MCTRLRFFDSPLTDGGGSWSKSRYLGLRCPGRNTLLGCLVSPLVRLECSTDWCWQSNPSLAMVAVAVRAWSFSWLTVSFDCIGSAAHV